MAHQGAERFPVERLGRHHDHDGHERNHRHLRHPVFQRHHEDEQEHARKQRGQAPAPAVLHVAHGLADHSAARNAAKPAGRDVGQPQARAFAVLVAGGVGQLIDHGGGEHRFEQAHHGNRQRR